MSNFDDLIKDKKVANHPLLKGFKNLSKIKESMNRYNEGLEKRKKSNNYNSLFSFGKGDKKDLRSTVFEASCILNDVLCQYDIPIFPKVSFMNTRDLKYAKHDHERVVSGGVMFKIEFQSLSGPKKDAIVCVPICKGELNYPSVLDVDGTTQVLAQKTIDGIVGKITSYSLPPVKKTWIQPPMDRDEREMNVSLRNEIGYEPRVLVPKTSAKKVPTGYSEVVSMMEEAEKNKEDTFPRLYEYLLRNYILEHLNVAEKDNWMPHLINDGFCVNPYGTNVRTRKKKSQELDEEKFEEGVEDNMESEDAMLYKYYMDTKTPIEVSDPIRFKDSKGNGVKGVIVDIDFENDFLIIKSRGMEYRVKVEDIEPLPSTFRKMYK